MSRKVAQQLDDLRDMVIVFSVLGAGLRIEEIVPGYQLENLDRIRPGRQGLVRGRSNMYHACHAPDIRTGTPLTPQYHFWRSILPSLDIVREVLARPTGISQVCNLDGYDSNIRHFVILLRLVQCYTRYLPGHNITDPSPSVSNFYNVLHGIWGPTLFAPWPCSWIRHRHSRCRRVKDLNCCSSMLSLNSLICSENFD
jgi:hypothetical protein